MTVVVRKGVSLKKGSVSFLNEDLAGSRFTGQNLRRFDRIDFARHDAERPLMALLKNEPTTMVVGGNKITDPSGKLLS